MGQVNLEKGVAPEQGARAEKEEEEAWRTQAGNRKPSGTGRRRRRENGREIGGFVEGNTTEGKGWRRKKRWRQSRMRTF